MTNREKLMEIFPEAQIQTLSGDTGCLYFDYEWLNSEYIYLGSRRCKNCMHYNKVDKYCGYHSGKLMNSCPPEYYCGDFEAKEVDK